MSSFRPHPPPPQHSRGSTSQAGRLAGAYWRLGKGGEALGHRRICPFMATWPQESPLAVCSREGLPPSCQGGGIEPADRLPDMGVLPLQVLITGKGAAPPTPARQDHTGCAPPPRAPRDTLLALACAVCTGRVERAPAQMAVGRPGPRFQTSTAAPGAYFHLPHPALTWPLVGGLLCKTADRKFPRELLLEGQGQVHVG